MKSLYSRGEEIFNGVSHIVGGGLGIIFLIISIILANYYSDVTSILAVIIYGLGMITLYTMSSLYHMLKDGTGKKVMQIMDHCTIYLLIAGTYTPFILVAMRNFLGYIILGIVWGISIVGITLNAIMMKNKWVKIFSYISYLALGWCIIFALPTLLKQISINCLIFLIIGGVFYTSGFIFYALGKKKKWFHSIWHLFVLLGSIFQFISLIFLFI